METIELILIKPDLSNDIGWVIEEPSDKESYRELDRKTFTIPEGFRVAETTMGELGIFDSKDNYCEIETNPKTKIPYVVSIANGYGECASLKTADLVFTKVKDLRRAAGFTQKEFADYFDLPLRTLQGWESEGRSSPPDYLLKLFEYKLRNENLLTGEVEENQI